MLAARATESRRCSGSVLSDASIGWGMEVVRDRVVGSEFGVVRYDGGVVAYRLVSGYGVVVPDAGLMGVLGRMRVLAVVAGGEEEEFDGPSNVVFWPGEYRAVNCILPCPPDVRSCGGGGGGGSNMCCSGNAWVAQHCNECDSDEFTCVGDCVPVYSCDCRNFRDYCTETLFCLDIKL